jgi:hypothetical protein
MVVYGKAKRDNNHAHNDVGQVCIDAMGQRMIIDPGSPSAYPADFFDEHRWKYYNASAFGHNVPMFGGREQQFTPHNRGVKSGIDFASVNGRILQAEFDDETGGFWQMDLSKAYDGVLRVVRTVVHLFPGFVAVLDEGELGKAEDISLRWHMIEVPDLKKDGALQLVSRGVGLTGQIDVIAGSLIEHRIQHHEYQAPFNRDRMGDLLDQRREPYVEIRLRDKQYRVLTMFALNTDSSKSWVPEETSWKILTNDGDCEMSLSDSELRVFSSSGRIEFVVRL